MELFAILGIFDATVIAIDVKAWPRHHRHYELQVIARQAAAAQNGLDTLKPVFDVQAIDCWDDLVADGQEQHCLLAPAPKEKATGGIGSIIPEIAVAIVACGTILVMCIISRTVPPNQVSVRRSIGSVKA